MHPRMTFFTLLLLTLLINDATLNSSGPSTTPGSPCWEEPYFGAPRLENEKIMESAMGACYLCYEDPVDVRKICNCPNGWTCRGCFGRLLQDDNTYTCGYCTFWFTYRPGTKTIIRPAGTSFNVAGTSSNVRVGSDFNRTNVRTIVGLLQDYGLNLGRPNIKKIVFLLNRSEDFITNQQEYQYLLTPTRELHSDRNYHWVVQEVASYLIRESVLRREDAQYLFSVINAVVYYCRPEVRSVPRRWYPHSIL